MQVENWHRIVPVSVSNSSSSFGSFSRVILFPHLCKKYFIALGSEDTKQRNLYSICLRKGYILGDGWRENKQNKYTDKIIRNCAAVTKGTSRIPPLILQTRLGFCISYLRAKTAVFCLWHLTLFTVFE